MHFYTEEEANFYMAVYDPNEEEFEDEEDEEDEEDDEEDEEDDEE